MDIYTRQLLKKIYYKPTTTRIIEKLLQILWWLTDSYLLTNWPNGGQTDKYENIKCTP